MGEHFTDENARDALESMMREHGDSIVRLCALYLRDAALAQDAAQETFFKAFRHYHAFRHESSEKTWLSRIAMNTCRDMLRKGWLRMMKKSEPIEQLLALAAPQQEEHTGLRDAVLALPGKYREVIVLYYDQEMTMKEISDALALPVHTVSTRLRRARALLKKTLGEEVDA